MRLMSNPTGKHRPKHRHPGEGTVVRRKDRWRSKPWAAVVPYTDASGQAGDVAIRRVPIRGGGDPT